MKAADFRKQLGLPPAGYTEGIRVGGLRSDKPAIRLPNLSGPNKIEAEYGRILETEFRYCDGIVKYEAITLRLPGGSRFTPDWTVWDGKRLMLCVETKGSYRLGSAGRSHTAFKEAIAAFPHLKFRFAQKDKKDGWKTIEAN